ASRSSTWWRVRDWKKSSLSGSTRCPGLRLDASLCNAQRDDLAFAIRPFHTARPRQRRVDLGAYLTAFSHGPASLGLLRSPFGEARFLEMTCGSCFLYLPRRRALRCTLYYVTYFRNNPDGWRRDTWILTKFNFTGHVQPESSLTQGQDISGTLGPMGRRVPILFRCRRVTGPLCSRQSKMTSARRHALICWKKPSVSMRCSIRFATEPTTRSRRRGRPVANRSAAASLLALGGQTRRAREP